MKTNKELLFSITKKDFNIDTFRSGGKGGQHQNKRDSGVRVTHKDSGAVGTARDSRSQSDNRNNAFQRCINSTKFQTWLKIEIAKRQTSVVDVNAKVDHMMMPWNLKTEYFESD